MASDDLLDTAELAELLHLSTRTVIRWRQARIGPAWIKAGGRLLYRRSDVDAWLSAQRVEPARSTERGTAT